MNISFIKQTSEDYGLDFEIVLNIYLKHKDCFYEKLEGLIKDRIAV